MTDFVTPSPEEISHRRRALRQQRRLRNLQSIWRLLAIAGLATGTFWLVKNPFWLILRSHDQVIVDGNVLLTDTAVNELLAFQYPQPLLEIEPEVVAERLRAQAPVAFAQVNRQLFPPRIEIVLQERQPVAVTVPSQPGAAAAEQTPNNFPGLLDAEGYWMPQTEEAGIDRNFDQPTLRVRGFHARYQRQWPDLYQTVRSSTVKISEVDWRSPNNLILKTELGTVHLGIYHSQRLQEQLSVLPRFRSLATHQNAAAVEYIDLSNPQTPAVKLSQTPETTAEMP